MIQYILTETAHKLLAKGIDVRPKRGTEFAAGMDLAACIEEPVTIFPGHITKIYTGLKIFLGTDTLIYKDIHLAGLYLPRSSNTEMLLANTIGLLDGDFQHESFLKVTARENSFVINPGDRLAQLVVIPCINFPWKEVESFAQTTSRLGGDGSTGGNYSHHEEELTFTDAQSYLGLTDAQMLEYSRKDICYSLRHGSRFFKKSELDRFRKEVLNANSNIR